MSISEVNSSFLSFNETRIRPAGDFTFQNANTDVHKVLYRFEDIRFEPNCQYMVEEEIYFDSVIPIDEEGHELDKNTDTIHKGSGIYLSLMNYVVYPSDGSLLRYIDLDTIYDQRVEHKSVIRVKYLFTTPKDLAPGSELRVPLIECVGREDADG
jgi:hypothetical protein